MSGWKRLFIFFVILISIPALGLWYSSKPPSPYSEYLVDCYDTFSKISIIPAVGQQKNPFNSSQLMSEKDAAEYLEFLSNGIDLWSDKVDVFFSEKNTIPLEKINDHPATDYLQSVSITEFKKCKEALNNLKSGRLEKAATNDWLNDFKVGFIYLALFFAAIYIVGWGLGWVWRGFRQSKK